MSTMRIHKYLVAASNEVKLNFKYRANLLVSVSYIIFPFLAYAFLWAAVYRHGGQIGNYSGNQMLTYYLFVLVIGGTMPIFAYSDISKSIKNGDLSYFLIRPISFVGYYYSVLFGASVMWLIAHIIGVLPLLIFFKDKIILPGVQDLLWGVVFYIVAHALAFMAGVIFNLLSFWVGNPYGFSQLWAFTIGLLGGEVLPLDLIPVGQVLNYLPFKFIFYVPIQVLVGRMALSDKLSNLFVGIVWILVLRAIVQLMWLAGLKRYEAVGG